jgi:hypothetical protein
MMGNARRVLATAPRDRELLLISKFMDLAGLHGFR